MRHYIEQVSVSELLPYVNNSRTHSAEQLQQIAASIQQFGFTAPILCDQEGMVLAGHGRIMAAKALGMLTVPAIKLSHLSSAQKKAYIIADNKIALNSGWDLELLRTELEFLQEQDFDHSVLGFATEELASIFGLQHEEDEADQQELEQEKFEVVVRCINEMHQTELLDEFEGRCLECRALV